MVVDNLSRSYESSGSQARLPILHSYDKLTYPETIVLHQRSPVMLVVFSLAEIPAIRIQHSELVLRAAELYEVLIEVTDP